MILQYFLDTDTDTASVFFRWNTDIDTSVFWKHTEYWILVLLFCTGQCSALFMVTNWKGAWNLTSVLMLLTSCACLLATIISCMLIGQRKPFTRLVTSRFQCDKSLTRHIIYFGKISPKHLKHLTYVDW